MALRLATASRLASIVTCQRELYMFTGENPVTVDRKLRQSGDQTEAGGRQEPLAPARPCREDEYAGAVMAPLTMCAVKRRVVLVYTFVFVCSRYGAGSPSGRSFAPPSDRTSSLE
jgi:hypothetical protein